MKPNAPQTHQTHRDLWQDGSVKQVTNRTPDSAFEGLLGHKHLLMSGMQRHGDGLQTGHFQSREHLSINACAAWQQDLYASGTPRKGARKGHNGQRNDSQMLQLTHPNGPHTGQRGHNRAMNAPFSDGIAQYPQPIRNRNHANPQLEHCQSTRRSGTKWGRAPTIGAPTRWTSHPPGLRSSAPAIVRSVTGQLQPSRPERVVSDTKKVPTASAQLVLAGMDNNLFNGCANPHPNPLPTGEGVTAQAGKYQLELPSKNDIQRFLEEKIREVGDA